MNSTTPPKKYVASGYSCLKDVAMITGSLYPQKGFGPYPNRFLAIRLKNCPPTTSPTADHARQFIEDHDQSWKACGFVTDATGWIYLDPTHFSHASLRIVNKLTETFGRHNIADVITFDLAA